MAEIDELTDGLYLEDYIRDNTKQLEAKLRNQELLNSYKQVWMSPDGRRVMWDLLSQCKVFHLSMTGNSWTYFNEGCRQIGLYLLSMLNVGNKQEDVLGFQQMKPEKNG